MEKEYSAKSKLTDSELTTLILLIRKIRKAAKERGIEMSKEQAKRHALEHLGWTSNDRLEKQRHHLLSVKGSEQQTRGSTNPINHLN